jgi:outer membrane lipoprotein-sorting protein
MREILKIPVFSADWRRIPIWAGLSIAMLLWLATAGCIKQTIKTKVPEKILQAKTAVLQDLLNLIQRYDRIDDLSSSSLDVSLFSGKRDSGIIQKIRKLPGYILLKRPDSIHLVIQNFVTKSPVVELLAVGDDLSIWIGRGNKLYNGKNSARELVVDATPDSPAVAIPIRGTHIFEAIFPQSIKIDAPGFRYSLEEQADSAAKYYVLTSYRDGSGQRISTTRKIWIERSSLTISRQQIYLDDGQLESDIAYSDMALIDGLYMPHKIHIDRPLDGYALDMEFKSWRINPVLPDNAFVLTPHAGAQIIPLMEKAL